jgi:single-strand DNA-binding protein
MANFNRVIIVGNLTKEPELKYTPKGTAVLSITIAVNRKYKSGEDKKQETAFVPVVAWSKTAELINQYCHKGDPLMVEGRLQTRTYEKEGQKHYVMEVVVENMQLMGGKKESESPEQAQEEEPLWPGEEGK